MLITLLFFISLKLVPYFGIYEKHFSAFRNVKPTSAKIMFEDKFIEYCITALTSYLKLCKANIENECIDDIHVLSAFLFLHRKHLRKFFAVCLVFDRAPPYFLRIKLAFSTRIKIQGKLFLGML